MLPRPFIALLPGLPKPQIHCIFSMQIIIRNFTEQCCLVLLFYSQIDKTLYIMLINKKRFEALTLNTQVKNQ